MDAQVTDAIIANNFIFRAQTLTEAQKVMVEKNPPGKLGLFVRFSESSAWILLRTDHPAAYRSGITGALKYLTKQKNEWQHNGPPEYMTADYHIEPIVNWS